MTCPTCGGEIPVGFSTCAPCRQHESMGVDIRARILWGEAREEIRKDWIWKGASEDDVDTFVRVALQERRKHFRSRGFQDLLIALVVWLLAGAAIWAHYAEIHQMLTLRPKTSALVIAAMVFLPVVGLILTGRGVRRVLIGGEETEAASDLSEFD